ncbi:hypothetical protein CEXT_562901 [Caerostris extrusa]|uniref:Uncharacterized protein n=1 Tax=Caerostris extrusa TaxID=172846 RepID=A0AAV4WP83_CAEEX|nr:hypothetical protein CEXT_562901 [Caerostris extrusa]
MSISPPELRKAQKPAPPTFLASVSIRHERSRPNLSRPKNKEISRLQANLISGIPRGRNIYLHFSPTTAEGPETAPPSLLASVSIRHERSRPNLSPKEQRDLSSASEPHLRHSPRKGYLSPFVPRCREGKSVPRP